MNEDEVIQEAKCVAMANSQLSRETRLIRNLLAIIDRMSRLRDPEYRAAINAERSMSHDNQ